MTTGAGPVGVMVVRIWTEGSDRRLRARITYALDISSRQESSMVIGTVEEIVAVVQEWGESFVALADKGRA